MRARKGFADEVRREIQRQCDLGEIEYEKLERISPRSLFLWLFGGVAVYVLIHQITDVKGAVDQVKDLDWAWVVPLLLVSFLSYVGGAIAMAGSVPNALPAWPLFMTQFASSFTNRVTPAKVGGTAVNIRFLQKSGVDNAVAVTGVGLVMMFGLVVHVCFIVVFLLFAGQEHQKGVRLPSEQDALLVFAGLMLILIAILVLPFGRRLAIDRVVPLLKRAWSGAEQIAHRPSKIALLVGGSAIVTLSYASCCTSRCSRSAAASASPPSSRCTSPVVRSRARRRRPAGSARSKPCSSPGS